jgi:hypothetical protein
MGDVLKYELNPNYTRETVTLLAGRHRTIPPAPCSGQHHRQRASYALATSTPAPTAPQIAAAAVLLYPVDATLAPTPSASWIAPRPGDPLEAPRSPIDATVDDAPQDHRHEAWTSWPPWASCTRDTA